MNTYQCWCPYDKSVPTEFKKAETSFAARQEFARKFRKQVTDIVARRQWEKMPRVFSDGTGIRDEP